MHNAFEFLIRSIFGFFILLLLARFYLQAAKVSFRHPLGQFVLALTNWAVLPTRRILPALKNYDSSSLVLAWLSALGMQILLFTITPFTYVFFAIEPILALSLSAVLELIKMSFNLLFFAIIGQILMSWLSPYNPSLAIINSLTAPFLRPIQKIIRPISGVDISPFILILLIQFCLLFVPALEQSILQHVVMKN